MEAEDVVFLASPLTFDPSVVDLFLALSSGAQVLIIPSVIKKMPGRLARLLFEDHKTTVLQVNVFFFLFGKTTETCRTLVIFLSFFFLSSNPAGHPNAARPIWTSCLETGSAVPSFFAASVGSGRRSLPLASSAESLETQRQQDQHLQHLWHH